MKTISIIIPTFQHALTIQGVIESILAQERNPEEIIVVDDGSTDKTRELLEAFGSRVTYVWQDNAGAPSARMRGFEMSKGELVLFCDADVCLRPDALGKLEAALDAHTEASYAYSSFLWGRRHFPSRPFDAHSLRENNYIHTTALIRREHFPGFDVSLKRFQDWDLWLTMLEHGHTGVFVDEELFDVTRVPGRKNISRWLPSLAYRIPWDKLGWVPRAVREYEEARRVVTRKHGLDLLPPSSHATTHPVSSLREQFFGSLFWRGLAVIAVLYALGLVAYGRDSLSVTLLIAIGVAAAAVSFKRLDSGLALAFLELFSNPHGALNTTHEGGFTFSLRMAIFAGVMAGWGIGLLVRRFRFDPQDARLKPFVLLGLAVALGFIVGVLSREPSVVFADGNAYLYLLYLLPILCVDWSRERQRELLQLLAAGVAWVSLLSFALLYVFSHFGEGILRPTYVFFRDLRVAEITALGGGVSRVFIQSQVFVVIFGFLLFVYGAQGRTSRVIIMLQAVAWGVLLLSLSRSFWIGLVPAVAVMLFLLVLRTHKTVRVLLTEAPARAASVVLGAGLIVAVVLFPIPSQRINSFDLAQSLKDRALEDQDAGIVSRWKLLRPMLGKIFESPLIGSGFGGSVTFQTDDPRVRAIHPDGTWTTYSMEWGWLELWLKMGIVGPAAFLYAAYEILRRLLTRAQGQDGWLAIGLIGGLAFLYATHFFSPYLNHPIGLGYLLFLVPFLPTKNSDPVPIAVVESLFRASVKESPVAASLVTPVAPRQCPDVQQ